MIKFYGYKNCDSCRKAEKILAQANREYSFIDITEQPPSAGELEKILRLAGEAQNKLFNTSGKQYRELDIKQQLPNMNLQDVLRLLAGNGWLIKRPLVTDGRQATIGFKEAHFKSVWS